MLNARCRFPVLSSDDPKANFPVFIDIWMVDFGDERDCWRFEWVIRWEVDIDPECAFVVWFIFLKLNELFY